MRPNFPCIAAALLSGCAPSVISPVGQNLAKGIVATAPSANAVRVESKADILHQGKHLKFDVWIEADSSKGRLDALGPFGTPLATVIWDDSAWKAWLPGQATLLRGKGNSVNLPVLGLKDMRPSALVAPLLGRTLPSAGPVKTTTGEGSTLVLPATPNPTWSILLDPSTGLATRKQTLLDGRETEGLTFHDWRKEGEILIPGIIDRTTPDGQLLQLELRDWKTLQAVPPEHLELKFHSPVDTITLSRNDRGQTVYRIRAAGSNGGDTTTVVLSNQSYMVDAPLEEIDTFEPDDTTEIDSSELSDSTDEPEDATESIPSDSVAPSKTKQKPAVVAPQTPISATSSKKRRKL